MYLILPTGEKVYFDAADAALVLKHKWHRLKKRTIYACTKIKINGRWKTVRMHRLIKGAPPKMLVDHKDGDGLNNRRKNLREGTGNNNQWNRRANKGSSSKYKGVSWINLFNKWRASIQADKRQKTLGYFDSEITAARAYDTAARKLHGKFACLNFPRGNERKARR